MVINMRKYKTNFLSISIAAVMLSLFAIGCTDDSTGSDNGEMFDSGQLATGESFSYTFEEEGTFDYYCRNHDPNMTGRITVTSEAESSDPDTVRMENLSFLPGQLSVAPSTTVVWDNEGSEPHTVTSGTPSGNNGGGY